MQEFSGLEYLQMDIARSFGLDKKNWDARLAWFQENQQYIDAADIPAMVKLCRMAEDPAQALAGMLAYHKVSKGLPTGYLISLDSTASGVQLLALLSGDESAAAICNLINTGNREDAYTHVHEGVVQRVGSQAQLARSEVKLATMAYLYGSKAEPRKCFGEDTKELATFYQVVEELMPGADQLNKDLLNLWNPNALLYEWTLPDGFEVKTKVMVTVERTVEFLGELYPINYRVNAPQERGLSIPANIVHSIDGLVIREINRRCNYTLEKVERVMEILDRKECGASVHRDKDIQLLRIINLWEDTGFLSAVILEYIDHENRTHVSDRLHDQIIVLVNSMPEISFPVVCIHDCLRCSPNHGNAVRKQYINILSELAASRILDSIVSEITGTPISVGKLSHRLPALIQESEYAIC